MLQIDNKPINYTAVDITYYALKSNILIKLSTSRSKDIDSFIIDGSKVEIIVADQKYRAVLQEKSLKLSNSSLNYIIELRYSFSKNKKTTLDDKIKSIKAANEEL